MVQMYRVEKEVLSYQSLYQCHLVHHVCCRPFSFFLHVFEFYFVMVTCAGWLVSHVLSLTGLWQISLDVVVFGYVQQGVTVKCWDVFILGTRWQIIIFSSQCFSVCVPFDSLINS